MVCVSVPVLPGTELSVQEDVCVYSWPWVTAPASGLGGVACRGVECVVIIACVKHCHRVMYNYLFFVLCLHSP